jgi:hypothetical protein
VRSVVRISSHRSGRNIYRTVVSATCGPATVVDINLRTRSMSSQMIGAD